jgi:lysophospholipase L1-like esterase
MLKSEFLTLDDEVIIVPRILLAPELYQHAPGVPVVVTIGDSFTAGFPVEPSDAYPAVLERWLAERGHTARVVPAGMGDAGPDQQLRLLKTRILPRVRPAIVVWQLYANDLWDNIGKAVYALDGGTLVPLDPTTHWITVRQHLFGAMPVRWIRSRSYAFHLLLKATEARARRAVPEGVDEREWALDKLRAGLAELDRLSATHGFRTYVALVVPETLYLAARDPERWRDHWTAIEHGKLATVVGSRRDHIAVWLGAAYADEVFAGDGRDTTAIGDRHFNERGYAMMASIVGERMLRDGVFDHAAAPQRP